MGAFAFSLRPRTSQGGIAQHGTQNPAGTRRLDRLPGLPMRIIVSPRQIDDDATKQDYATMRLCDYNRVVVRGTRRLLGSTPPPPSLQRYSGLSSSIELPGTLGPEQADRQISTSPPRSKGTRHQMDDS
ncbi:uncharacterized protein N7482_000568 [Penicillium canariense]|uniref:Uncharacterized protein n=1 Tax=Penicillium canariense TaxID=189055 RepID=A0A9W9IFM1_9EURO|nr:uncharacterized protein N7482_000568 [Penicillium canariense]KAJ5174691.1 hypothetical protein N7482_000568 [Penicillium canariense]